MVHGVEINDPYQWLEDEDSDEVQAWMDVQDTWARGQLEAFDPAQRAALRQRFEELYYIDTLSAPRRYGPIYVYTRREAGQEKTAFYFREGADGEEQVLLDPNAFDEEQNISIENVFVTEDGARYAYTQSINASDEATLIVVDRASGNEIEELTGAKYAYPQWTLDGTGFYYTWLPPADGVSVDERPGLVEVHFHSVGTPQADDVLIRPASGDPTVFVSPYLSRNDRWLVTSISFGWASNDMLIRDLQSADPTDIPLFEGFDATFDGVFHQDSFFIRTNLDADHYRLMRLDLPMQPDVPAVDQWVEIIPESDTAVLEGVELVGGRLVLRYQENAASRMDLVSLDGSERTAIEMPGIGYIGSPVGNPDDSEFYASFQNFVTPPQIFQIDVDQGVPSLWHQIEVPIDPTPYVVEQQWATSADGQTQVPMFIVRAADQQGPGPTLLYGYGGFDVSLLPWFRSSIYPWLEAGGTYVVANIRGGGEFGSGWHEDGMLGNKQNVFDDFIAAAEHLIEQGITTTEQLGIYGGSNGGLLVGAAMTQRPDLFGAIACAVPLLDMVRFHRFGSGQTWTREYGNPDEPEAFAWIHAYSPYHRIEQGTSYPPLLMMSADSDDRVDPMHARKFVAAISYADPTSVTLLRIERDAGHGGADRVSQAIDSSVDLYSFLLHTIAR
jgi:prolyl oligopeptidase